MEQRARVCVCVLVWPCVGPLASGFQINSFSLFPVLCCNCVVRNAASNIHFYTYAPSLKSSSHLLTHPPFLPRSCSLSLSLSFYLCLQSLPVKHYRDPFPLSFFFLLPLCFTLYILFFILFSSSFTFIFAAPPTFLWLFFFPPPEIQVVKQIVITINYL